MLALGMILEVMRVWSLF